MTDRLRVRRLMKNRAACALAALLATPLQAQEAAPSPSPAPLAVDARRAGQDVPVPTRKKFVAPEYPPEAAAQGIRGIVIMDVLIGEDGRVNDARVTRSIPGLDEAALAAVKLWEYEPTKLAGKPVKVLLAQHITFALRLPELRRAPGVPELKSGGSPSVPAGRSTPGAASVSVTLGADGEVVEAAALDGDPAIGEALLRAVRAWRFVVSDSPTPSFTVRADWKPGPPPVLLLSAEDVKAPTSASPLPATLEARTSEPAATPAPESETASTPTTQTPTPAPAAPPAPQVDTEVLTARPAPAAKEEGMSTVADVTLGEKIPELARGRRPVWPPLARLGNIGGVVVVRFSVDLAGRTSVHSTEGPEMLRATAEQAVQTWLFRRTAIDRLNLIATFTFGADRTFAKVERVP